MRVNDLNTPIVANRIFFLIPFIYFFHVGLSLILLIIFVLLIVQDVLLNKKKINLTKYDKILLFFIFYILIINLFINFNTNNRILNLIIFSIFFIISKDYIDLKIINNKNFIKFYLIFLFFIFFDSFFQTLFGFNIAGFSKAQNYRISSFFRDEAILGSYLSWFTLPMISFFLSTNKFKFIKFIFFNLVLITILLTKERMALIAFCFMTFIIICYHKKFIYLLNFLFLMFLFFILIFRSNLFLENKKIIIQTLASTGLFSQSIGKLSPRFIEDNYIYDKIEKENYSIQNMNIKQKRFEDIRKRFESEINTYSRIDILDSFHGSIFYNTFLQIKKNLLIGKGIKSFRNECIKHKKEIEFEGNTYNLNCSTHPHNYYLELLYEAGIFGFLIFYIFLFSIFISLSRCHANNNNDLLYFLIFIKSFLLFSLFPLKVTGSIFASSNMIHFFYILAIANHYLYKHDRNNNI
jgi:hypothetical protein